MEKLKSRGVGNVIITLGKDGVYYASQDDTRHLSPYNIGGCRCHWSLRCICCGSAFKYGSRT